MRKRVAVVGHSEEGLALIPLLEANPEVEISAIVSPDPEAARAVLRRIDPSLPERFEARLTEDLESVLGSTGLAAVIDAEAPTALRERLEEAGEQGVQIISPLLGKLLFAFGPVDSSRKPELLHALSEVLESYNLTVDRRGLLNRILQIAVGVTGADRGSLMLWDAADGRLRVEVAIGIEPELISKIRVASGEGIAGRAFAEGRAVLLRGKADREDYLIVRERDDVESAVSAPLLHEERVLGVLNLSHVHRRDAFTPSDVDFIEQLARIDAKIIARAEEYHALRRESATLRSQAEVRRLLDLPQPLPERLAEVCRFVARELDGGICQLWLDDPERDALALQASSVGRDPFASPTRVGRDEGILGWVARSRNAVVLSDQIHGARICYAALPLEHGGELLGLLCFEGAREAAVSDLLGDTLWAAAQTLANELAAAMRALRIEREATKTAAITELASRMSSSDDSGELYRTITSSAAMILEAEHTLLRLRDDVSGRFQIRSYFGSADTEQQADLFALEKELAIEAIRRRGVLRVADLAKRSELDADQAGVQSALLLPLRRGGQVFGTLSALGKVGPDPLGGDCFLAEDEKILARLGEYASSALAAVHERERRRRVERFDELTGLPNALHLRERLEQEIARSSVRGTSLALVRLRVGGLKEWIETQQEAEGDRLVLSIAQELRAGLRDFDVLGRSSEDEFEMVIPEPEGDVSALLGPLARRVSDAIRREPEGAPELALEFGYALFPEDGQTPGTLRERAAEPRIRSI